MALWPFHVLQESSAKPKIQEPVQEQALPHCQNITVWQKSPTIWQKPQKKAPYPRYGHQMHHFSGTEDKSDKSQCRDQTVVESLFKIPSDAIWIILDHFGSIDLDEWWVDISGPQGGDSGDIERWQRTCHCDCSWRRFPAFERVKRVTLWCHSQGHPEEEVGWEYRRAAESSNRTFSGDRLSL